VRLSDLVSPQRVVIPLQEPTLARAVWALVERITAVGTVEDPERLQRRVEEERGEDIVALGDRAFLAHYRTDAVNDLVVAIGSSPTPIERKVGESETQHARIVVVILAPPRMAARHLQVLGAFVRLLSRAEVVEQFLAAPTAEELSTLAPLREVTLAPQLTVREIMVERPRTTKSDTPLRDAAREMVRGRISALPVVEGDGLLVGMLSEKELMRHMLSNALLGGSAHRPAPTGDIGRRTVREVMTRQVLCVSPDQPLAEVASLMTNKDVDQLPVVLGGRLVGFLTRADIVRKLIGP
jgi:CBS domain-containing protein